MEILKADNQLSIYDNAKHWVAQYEAVDDVKEFIDKTAAVEEYAKRAQDFELEIKAGRARVRAERKCGELLAGMEKAKGVADGRGGAGRGNKNVVVCDDRIFDKPKPQTLKELNLTKNQSSKFQKLAKVPEKVFEEHLTLPGSIPNSSSIIQSQEPKEKIKPINGDSLLFSSMMTNWEDELSDLDINILIQNLPLPEHDVALIPKLINWLEEYNVTH